jgi:hypothetical protein
MLAVCFQDAYISNIQPVQAQYIEHITMLTRGTANADNVL